MASDLCFVLVGAVVVAGDGASANVGRRANGAIPAIGQVVHLASFVQGGVFKFDKIADFALFV